MTKGVKQQTIKKKQNVKYGYHTKPQSTLNAFLGKPDKEDTMSQCTVSTAASTVYAG
jgi:hypothetical protein